MQVKFFHVGGACFVLDIDGQIKIGCDIFLNPIGTDYNFKIFKSKRIKEPIYEDGLFTGSMIWLFTHNHADHVDDIGIMELDTNSIIIAERKVLPSLTNKGFKQIHTLTWNQTETLELEGYQVIVKAVPAFHVNNLLIRTIVGKVNGYLLSVTKDNETINIYITSDTIYNKEIVNSMRGKGIDVLIANLGEVWSKGFGRPLTMSVDMLEKFVGDLHPKFVIPIHIDDFSHYQTREVDLIRKGFTIQKQGEWIELNLGPTDIF